MLYEVITDLMTEAAGDIDFCANAAVFGEVLFVDNDQDSEHVQLAFLAFDDTGMQVLISVNDIDLTQIGENPDGILDTPLVYDGCNFTAGVNLDANCDVYECTWSELSTNPCGGIVSTSATEVPITCYEDEQPDSCDPSA